MSCFIVLPLVFSPASPPHIT
ncbi:hypothetical protein HU200_044164 [Digitaria exilis]|uniref:Uncharacterized protein n=1 Tax=Digitaria exilis TaxID=1010633 RepID=A0A835BD36_9POAL|nr:hypothetical protein HU200_044164 [Digitaria exilis]